MDFDALIERLISDVAAQAILFADVLLGQWVSE